MIEFSGRKACTSCEEGTRTILECNSSESKVTEHWSDLVMQAIEMSQTVDEGMNKTFSSNKEDSLPTMSLIVPIPRALIEEPPTPVTVQSAMGCNVMKSE